MRSIAQKLIIFILLTSISIVAAGVLTVFSLRRIEDNFHNFIYKRTPVIKSTQVALVAFEEAEENIYQGLLTKNIKDIDKLRNNEALFNNEILEFDMFLAALKWGSQSEKFRTEDGGIIYSEWKRGGFDKKFTIPPAQNTALLSVNEINDQVNVFIKIVYEIFSLQRKLIRQEQELSPTDAALNTQKIVELTDSLETVKEGIHKNMDNFVAASDIETDREIKQQELIFSSVEKGILGIVAVHFILVFIFGTIFIRKIIVLPLRNLTNVVNDISKGKLDSKIDPKTLDSKDEMGELARAFDRTVVSLKLAMREQKKE